MQIIEINYCNFSRAKALTFYDFATYGVWKCEFYSWERTEFPANETSAAGEVEGSGRDKQTGIESIVEYALTQNGPSSTACESERNRRCSGLVMEIHRISANTIDQLLEMHAEMKKRRRRLKMEEYAFMEFLLTKQ